MKFSKIAVGLIIFILCGLTIFSLHVLRDEAAQDTKDLIAKGNQLVSLIPLYPLKQFKGAEGHFFLRTLTEYDANKNIAYLYIHDGDGRIVTSLAGAEISALIPEGVKLLSLNTIRLIRQPVNPAGGGEKIYEFAKPIFEAGEKVGVVRLGLKLPQTVYASMERFSMLALVAFFIISAMLLSYYGVMLALKPLRNISQNIQDACSGIDLNPKGVSRTSQIAPIVNELQGSLGTITERLNHIEQDNLNLASKLGVATFEKKQILKILDSINFGVIITDLQDNISHINEYMLKLLKKSPAEVLDHPFTEVVEHEDLQAFVSRYDALERSGSAVFIDTTFPELAPNEIYRVTSSYLLDDEKTPIGKMMTFSNITSEKLAENAKQDFIAHVAHELMTPLTNIRSYSEMLMDGEVEDLDMQKEFYNTINEQTTRLAGLIKNLLNLSKMEMGSLSIEKGLVKTDWFVEDCLSSMEASAKGKNITIEKKMPDIFPTLLADKDLLKAAVINILGNALKYTPEGGKISFGISEQDKMVVFDVIDTGYGIGEEELPYVFEKFFRSENPQVIEQTGSGLGLAITSEIVRLHGGEVDVDSELGEGTHFAIKIPKEDFYVGQE